MSLSSRKETDSSLNNSRRETLLNVKLMFKDVAQIIYNILTFSPNLSERISRYGKIRFLVVCDENLGRSQIFTALLKNHIKDFGLEDSVEVISAGTDVKDKKSDIKYAGRVHPEVEIVIKNIPSANPDEHHVTQLDETLITPNTILVVLNNVEKIPRKIKRKSYAVLDYSMDDPHDLGDGSLNERLLLLADRENYLARYIANILRFAFENNNLQLFQINDPMSSKNFRN